MKQKGDENRNIELKLPQIPGLQCLVTRKPQCQIHAA